MPQQRWTAFLLVCLTALLASCASSEGRTNFMFSAWDGPALTVYAVEPDGLDSAAPVVFVMHGVGRNADEYRDNWIEIAQQYGVRVYAPQFTQRDFPGADAYNLGGVEPGRARTVGAFDSIEPLFDYIRETRGVTAGTYNIFGHSAGAQFVHRLSCFTASPRMAMAIAANAGWYTLPTTDAEWPYGLGGIGKDVCNAADWLSRPLVILLGDADTDPNDPNLRRTPEAMAQGEHRYARGLFFFNTARELADREGLPFAWRVGTVKDVAHDNGAMARAAVRVITDAGSPR